jgi:hypothetical protein
MTELYMIQDKSADFEETWNFLARRIEDVSHLHSYLHQSGDISQVAKEAVAAAFITVRQYFDMVFVYIVMSYISSACFQNEKVFKLLHFAKCWDDLTEEDEWAEYVW